MIIGSNIVSNVPLVVLIAEKLASLAPDVLQPALLTAWVTTVGGRVVVVFFFLLFRQSDVVWQCEQPYCC